MRALLFGLLIVTVMLTALSFAVGAIVWALWNNGPAAAFSVPTMSYLQAVATTALAMLFAQSFKTEVQIKKS